MGPLDSDISLLSPMLGRRVRGPLLSKATSHVETAFRTFGSWPEGRTRYTLGSTACAWCPVGSSETVCRVLCVIYNFLQGLLGVPGKQNRGVGCNYLNTTTEMLPGNATPLLPHLPSVWRVLWMALVAQ